jgi:hypothetical protein
MCTFHALISSNKLFLNITMKRRRQFQKSHITNCENKPEQRGCTLSSKLQGYEQVVDFLKGSGILAQVNSKTTVSWDVTL